VTVSAEIVLERFEKKDWLKDPANFSIVDGRKLPKNL
jgi:hypothetical protein